VLYQQPLLNVPNVETIWHSGGCYKQGQLTKLQPNFIGAPNAATLGEIMHEKGYYCARSGSIKNNYINHYNKSQNL